MSGPEEEEQKRLGEVASAVQADWQQREFIEAAKSGILRIYEFLHTFELTTRSKIAALDARLASLESQLSQLEQRVTSRGPAASPEDSVQK